MKVMRRPWIEQPDGTYRPVNTVMTAEQSARFSRESLGNADFPEFDRDPSYQWGKPHRLAVKRRKKDHKAALARAMAKQEKSQ